MVADFEWRVPGEGFRRLGRRFTNLEDAFTDYRDLWPDVMGVIEDEMRFRFATEGRQGTGRPWAALSESYEPVKLAKWGNRPILVASGALADSLTNRDAAGAIAVMEPLQMIRGTDLQVGSADQWNLGLLHHFGAPRANLPARIIMVLSGVAQNRITRIIADWLRRRGRGL